MLKIADSHSPVATNENSYARWLRVIGQELSCLKFVCFEIEAEDSGFLIRRVNGKENGGKPGQSSVRKALASLLGNSCKETASGEAVRYTLDDLEQLDRKRMATRTGTGGTPDVHSLGEALRTVGRFVDAQGGRLLKLRKEPRRILIRYSEIDGRERAEEFLGFSLYKQQRGLNAGRQVLKDVWGAAAKD
jgi:hypothetical protein